MGQGSNRLQPVGDVLVVAPQDCLRDPLQMGIDGDDQDLGCATRAPLHVWRVVPLEILFPGAEVRPPSRFPCHPDHALRRLQGRAILCSHGLSLK